MRYLAVFLFFFGVICLWRVWLTLICSLILIALVPATMIGSYFLMKWAVTTSIANYGWPITLVGFVVWAIFCLLFCYWIDKRNAKAAAIAANDYSRWVRDRERAEPNQRTAPDYSAPMIQYVRSRLSLPALPAPSRDLSTDSRP